MSHFTVAVITEGRPTNEKIEEMLAPYDENLEVITYTSKQEAIDWERKEILEYKERVYDKYLADKEGYSMGASKEHIAYLEEEFPEKLTYNDEQLYEQFIKDGCYGSEDIMEDGSLRNRYNPKSKWDWYQIGGRWCGLLYIKRGGEGFTGKPSWTYEDIDDPWESKSEEYVCVDGARIKDLVFPEDEEEAKRAARFWELYIEGQEPVSEEDKEMIKFVFYTKEYYLEQYQTKENYIKAQTMFTTFAVITKDGEWHEKGKMGWWGCVSDEDTMGWIEGYNKIVFEDAGDDDWITIVDCHI